MLVAILFWSFSAVLVGAALGVILSRNPVHSVLYLVLCFFNAAVLWLLIQAEFLAIVLVLVYVGAVMVLFLFVVMMLDVNVEEVRKGFTRYMPLGVAVALIVVGIGWLVLYYLSEQEYPVMAWGYWNLAVGFGAMVASLALLSRWR